MSLCSQRQKVYAPAGGQRPIRGTQKVTQRARCLIVQDAIIDAVQVAKSHFVLQFSLRSLSFSRSNSERNHIVSEI